jgi:hypothetical protein
MKQSRRSGWGRGRWSSEIWRDGPRDTALGQVDAQAGGAGWPKGQGLGEPDPDRRVSRRSRWARTGRSRGHRREALVGAGSPWAGSKAGVWSRRKSPWGGPRAGKMGGCGWAGSRWRRMAETTGGSVRNARTLIWPPQAGQSSGSPSLMRARRTAQRMRVGFAGRVGSTGCG